MFNFKSSAAQHVPVTPTLFVVHTAHTENDNYPLRDTVQTLTTAGFWIDQLQAHSYWFSRCRTNQWAQLSQTNGQATKFSWHKRQLLLVWYTSMVFLLVALGNHPHCAGVLKSTHSLHRDCLVKRHHLLVYFGQFLRRRFLSVGGWNKGAFWFDRLDCKIKAHRGHTKTLKT